MVGDISQFVRAMARSNKRTVAEYRCLRRFRRRRLLDFLRHDNLPATFEALKHETRVFFDVRFLQSLVVGGRWQEARGYVKSFLPCQEHLMSDEADSALEFLTRLNVLDDLAHGRLGGDDAVSNLERQIEAIPSTMADPDYTEAVHTVFGLYEHPAYWDPTDWRAIRLKASQIVKNFISQAPEFSHLLRLPRCPINPHYTIPFHFGHRRRHQTKSTRQMPASLLARSFLRKYRHPPPCTQGSPSKTTDFEELVVETLHAGNLKGRGHPSFYVEGIPDAPVVSSTGTNFGKPSSNAATKRLNQEDCCAESSAGAKHLHTTGEFCPDVVDPPSGGMDPMHVIKKVDDLRGISGGALSLLLKICPDGPDRSMFMGKLLELERLLDELRADSIKATIKDCIPIGTTVASEDSASFSCI